MLNILHIRLRRPSHSSSLVSCSRCLRYQPGTNGRTEDDARSIKAHPSAISVKFSAFTFQLMRARSVWKGSRLTKSIIQLVYSAASLLSSDTC